MTYEECAYICSEVGITRQSLLHFSQGYLCHWNNEGNLYKEFAACIKEYFQFKEHSNHE